MFLFIYEYIFYFEILYYRGQEADNLNNKIGENFCLSSHHQVLKIMIIGEKTLSLIFFSFSMTI